jgi:hypothetical protein
MLEIRTTQKDFLQELISLKFLPSLTEGLSFDSKFNCNLLKPKVRVRVRVKEES